MKQRHTGFLSIIDDIWIDIFCFLSIKAFLHISQTCTHFNKLASHRKIDQRHNNHSRINKYWETNCKRICSNIHPTFGTNNWHLLYIELISLLIDNGLIKEIDRSTLEIIQPVPPLMLEARASTTGSFLKQFIDSSMKKENNDSNNKKHINDKQTQGTALNSNFDEPAHKYQFEMESFDLESELISEIDLDCWDYSIEPMSLILQTCKNDFLYIFSMLLHKMCDKYIHQLQQGTQMAKIRNTRLGSQPSASNDNDDESESGDENKVKSQDLIEVKRILDAEYSAGGDSYFVKKQRILYTCCQHNSIKILKYLLSNKVYKQLFCVNLKSKNQETPLYCAAKNGSYEAVEILLKYFDTWQGGIDKNTSQKIEKDNVIDVNCNGNTVKDPHTALHIAYRYDDDNHRKIAKLLLTHGAKVDVEF